MGIAYAALYAVAGKLQPSRNFRIQYLKAGNRAKRDFSEKYFHFSERKTIFSEKCFYLFEGKAGFSEECVHFSEGKAPNAVRRKFKK